MNFLLENWGLFFVFSGVVGLVGVGIRWFLKLPPKEQMAKVKEWLLYACTQAEAELGSGTGQLKLGYVYDLFVARFPMLIKVIPLPVFKRLVDEALEEMRKMLTENQAVRMIVQGGEVHETH